MALAGDETRSADVVAVEDSRVAVLTLASLEQLTLQDPWLSTKLEVNLARVLATRLRSANEQLRLLSR
jgi:CRP-like cAMP-binding protein